MRAAATPAVEITDATHSGENRPIMLPSRSRVGIASTNTSCSVGHPTVDRLGQTVAGRSGVGRLGPHGGRPGRRRQRWWRCEPKTATGREERREAVGEGAGRVAEHRYGVVNVHRVADTAGRDERRRADGGLDDGQIVDVVAGQDPVGRLTISPLRAQHFGDTARRPVRSPQSPGERVSERDRAIESPPPAVGGRGDHRASRCGARNEPPRRAAFIAARGRPPEPRARPSAAACKGDSVSSSAAAVNAGGCAMSSRR